MGLIDGPNFVDDIPYLILYFMGLGSMIISYSESFLSRTDRLRSFFIMGPVPQSKEAKTPLKFISIFIFFLMFVLTITTPFAGWDTVAAIICFVIQVAAFLCYMGIIIPSTKELLYVIWQSLKRNFSFSFGGPPNTSGTY
jgi:hypothetical protein